MTATAARVPSLNPVPPLPAGPSQVPPWREIAALAQAGTFRLRCPATSPAGLLGPFAGEGNCLAPVFHHGRNLKWFDPTIPAADGDFVLVELSQRLIGELWERNSHKPGFLETYGARPAKVYATKWLRHFRGQLYIFEHDKGVPLWDNKILGVLTYVVQDGAPVYGSGPDHHGWADAMPVATDQGIVLNEASGTISTPQIDLNAATEVLFDFDAGPVVASNPSSVPFATDVISLNVGLENATDTVQISVTGRMEIEQTAGGTPYDKVVLGAVGIFDPGGENEVQSAEAFTIEEEEGAFNFSLVGSFDVFSNGADTGIYTFGLRSTIFSGGSTITVETTFTNLNLVVAVFKR